MTTFGMPAPFWEARLDSLMAGTPPRCEDGEYEGGRTSCPRRGQQAERALRPERDKPDGPACRRCSTGSLCDLRCLVDVARNLGRGAATASGRHCVDLVPCRSRTDVPNVPGSDRPNGIPIGWTM